MPISAVLLCRAAPALAMDAHAQGFRACRPQFACRHAEALAYAQLLAGRHQLLSVQQRAAWMHTPQGTAKRTKSFEPSWAIGAENRVHPGHCLLAALAHGLRKRLPRRGALAKLFGGGLHAHYSRGQLKSAAAA